MICAPTKHVERATRFAARAAAVGLSGVVACVLAMPAQAQTNAAPGRCPGVVSWVHASKVATLQGQDTGLPDFNPKKHLNQVTYVGRFVLVSQIGVVAGLPHRPPVLISGLDAPKVRIASRVHEVEWRMINAAHTPLRLKIVSHSGSGAPGAVVDCQLAPPRSKSGHGRSFAYLKLFWKPAAQETYQYKVSFEKQQVQGTIERVKVGLRYGK